MGVRSQGRTRCGTDRTPPGCLERSADMARVVVPTVIGFLALMGVWIAFEAVHMMAM